MSSSETSSSGKQVALNLRATDRFTEIRVLNARFEPVALSANTGSTTVNVAPGLYEVGFRQGKDDWQSQHVVASPGMSEVTVQQRSSALELKSAPPFRSSRRDRGRTPTPRWWYR